MIRRALVLLIAAACAARGADDAEALKKRVAELEQQVAELKRTTIPIRALLDAKEKLSFALNDGAFDQDGKVTDVAATLLPLTDTERAAVEKGYAKYRDDQAAIAKGITAEPKISGDRLTLQLPDLSDRYRTVDDAWQKSAVAALGEERALLLDRLTNGRPGASKPSEVASTTITIGAEIDGNRDYMLETSTKSGGHTSYSTTAPSMPDSVRPYAALIPKKFGGERADDGKAPAAGDAPSHGGKTEF